RIPRSKPHRQVFVESVLAERTYRDLDAETSDPERELELVDRMALGGRLVRPVRADHEDPSGLASPGKRVEEIDRRGIAPVQILDHEQERHGGGDRVDRVDELAEHPLGRCAGDPATQRIELAVWDERRHLSEPQRSVAGEDGYEIPSAFAATEPREGLEDRE